MQSTPTTAQILEGIRADLRQTILPEVAAGPARVTLEMLDNLLSSAATRAGHEVAWMRDECDRMEAIADEVDDPAVREALAAYRVGDRESLHLEAVQQAYQQASEVLSRVIEHALATSNKALLEQARQVLRLRSEREVAILGEWTLAGRG